MYLLLLVEKNWKVIDNYCIVIYYQRNLLFE